MLRSTEIRWAAFLSLFIASTGCESEVVGGSGSGGAGGGGSGGGGAAQGTGGFGGGPVTTGGFSVGPGVAPYTSETCVDRTELWEQVLASQGEGGSSQSGSGQGGSGQGGAGQGGEGASGPGGSGQGGSAGTAGQGGAGQGASGQGGSMTTSGQGGAGGGIPAECPSVTDAEPFLNAYDVTGGPAAGPDDTCCYEIYNAASTGRPMLVDGRPTRADVAQGTGWAERGIDREAAGLSPEARAHLHTYWLTVARFEHASIASFAKFSLELLLLGAPADLVREAQRAGVDEVDHATATFAIAASYGEASSRPLPMPELAHVRPEADVVAIVRGAIAEGCVAETLGAFEAGEQAALAEAADLRATLSTIADDEARHAALAWRFVRWALDAGHVDAATVRDAFRGAIAEQRAMLDATSDRASHHEAILEHHGWLSPARRARLHAEVLARVEGLASELFSRGE